MFWGPRENDSLGPAVALEGPGYYRLTLHLLNRSINCTRFIQGPKTWSTT